ncbi:hypothetical protein ULMA_08270 [Patiriisocius marinus]|uniref:Uncharacterized protein n=1 Tax=Patiriisocius marinus TaxID=1397112 RepID=A0A5J4IN01_9FLAO|nr:hypothetical protein [Patiriisocius marinus]GER58719.1 hypothetical protein ULMA_08270 [Patiriisocius marinus]
MYYLRKLIIIQITTLILVGCNSTKEQTNTNKDYNFIESPSFTIIESYYQHWVAGVQGGGSGINVTIKLDNFVKGVTFENLFFEGKSAPLKEQKINTQVYQAKFKGDNNNEIIMDGEIINEMANTPPVKIPFNLNKNEAVVSYIENGKLKFFKISALQEKPMIAYPSANPNNNN